MLTLGVKGSNNFINEKRASEILGAGDQRMPSKPANRHSKCCKKLKELGITTKNIQRSASRTADKVRKDAEKGIRTGKPPKPRRKPRSK